MAINISNTFINNNFFDYYHETEETVSEFGIITDTPLNMESTFLISPNISNTSSTLPKEEETFANNLYHLHPKETESTTTSIFETPILPSTNIMLNKKKRGRKRKEYKTSEQYLPFKIGCHDDKDEDNMMKKIKPHYHKFLVLFLNNCIKQAGLIEELKKLEGKFNSDTSIGRNQGLFNSCLAQVLSQPISSKCKNYSKDHNIKVIENIKGKDVCLDEVLSFTYDYVYSEMFLNKNVKNKKLEKYVNCIPNEYILDSLLRKQRKELRQELYVFAHEKFVQKILNGVPRKTKYII